MSEIENPHMFPHAHGDYIGIKLRDYLAAKSMDYFLHQFSNFETAATHAYAMADAMLKVRESNA